MNGCPLCASIFYHVTNRSTLTIYKSTHRTNAIDVLLCIVYITIWNKFKVKMGLHAWCQNAAIYPQKKRSHVSKENLSREMYGNIENVSPRMEIFINTMLYWLIILIKLDILYQFDPHYVFCIGTLRVFFKLLTCIPCTFIFFAHLKVVTC